MGGAVVSAPRTLIAIVLLLPLLLLGSLFAPAVAAGVAGVLAISAWIWLAVKRPAIAVVVVIVIVLFSSHVLAIAYAQLGVPAGIVRAAITLKDALAWSLVIVLTARALLTHRSATPVLVLGGVGALVATFLVLGSANVEFAAQLQSVRGALVPFLALTIGALLTRDELKTVAQGLVYSTTIAALTGLVQLAFSPEFVRDFIGVGPYWAEVKGSGIFLTPWTGLPGNYFTAQGFPRLAGMIGDPLAAGMILGAVLIVAVAYRQYLRGYKLIVLVLSVSLLLTFTRNGWVIAAAGLVAFSLRRAGFGRTILRLGAVAAIVLLAINAIAPLQRYVNGVVNGNDGSTIAHQQALSHALNHAFEIVGGGWGTGGAAASTLNEDAVSSESAYVAVVAQLGWLGGIMFACLLVLLIFEVLRESPNRSSALGLLVGLAFTGIVSENILTFNAGWIPFLAVSLVAAAPIRVSQTSSNDESFAGRQSMVAPSSSFRAPSALQGLPADSVEISRGSAGRGGRMA